MKRYLILIGVIILIIIPSLSYAAGTITVNSPTDRTRHNIQVIIWTWTGDGSGDATTTATEPITGFISEVDFASVDGTALYDVVVNTEDGQDILMGVGANVPSGVTVTTLRRTPLTSDAMPIYVNHEKVTPVISNSGATKTGTITLIILETGR